MASHPASEPSRDGLTAPWLVFWVAFLVRVAYITLAHTYRVRPYDDHFAFGFEGGRIARALVEGSGYADPFANSWVRHSGPTAWLPPLYPLLMAGVFKLFGVYTASSAWVILVINSLFSAFTARTVWELGARFAGPGCGAWSGWLWALYPAAMQYSVKWIWEMSITTALFAWVLVLALRMRADAKNQTKRWLLFGLLWGLIALSNSSLLLFLPVCGIWILLGTHKQRFVLRDATLAAVVFLGCIAPWTIRNERVFHAFIPMRGNFGAELYLGNGPGANGLLMEYNHPAQAGDQAILYAKMGEVRYVAMRGALARKAIAADPLHFVADTLWRVYFFWASVPHDSGSSSGLNSIGEDFRILNYALISVAGLLGLALAFARRKPAAALFAWALLLLPLPYYVINVAARFRHPLEPILCVLVVYLFQSAERSQKQAKNYLG